MRKARLTGELKLIADEIGGWAKQWESIVRLWHVVAGERLQAPTSTSGVRVGCAAHRARPGSRYQPDRSFSSA